jgi:MoxR-like ATPase
VVDLAYRYAAWVGSRPVAPDQVAAVKRYVQALTSLARTVDDPTRPEPTAQAARAWFVDDPEQPSTREAPEADPLARRLRAILEHLDHAFLERGPHVRAALLALLSGQHTVLLGPPGTAKSLLARALCQCFEGAGYFEYLLSRFTHPDELFGPVSIPGLKEEDYRRLTTGFLPQAHVAFLDEIFKANSSILNSLLTLINERIFHHGRHRDPVPLLGLLGASNELPDPDGGLGALYDRFLVRLSVPPLAEPAHFLQVATGEVAAAHVPPSLRLTLDEVHALRARAAEVVVPEHVAAALQALWSTAAASEWGVSDRRWRQAVSMLRVAAISCGRHALDPMDLLLLEPVLAPTPEQQPEVREALLRHVRPAAVPQHDLRAQWILLHSDRVAPTPDDPAPARAASGLWRDRIATRRASIERYLTHVHSSVERLAHGRSSLEGTADGHLWVHGLPVELLTPHLEASRDLARLLRHGEQYLAGFATEQSLLGEVLGWLPLEDRVPPANMQCVLKIMGDEGFAVGMSYRSWKRIPSPYDGPAMLTVESGHFLDWVEGTLDTRPLLAGLRGRDAVSTRQQLDALREQLAIHLVPSPGNAPA